jgi:hypothetical protein
MERFNWIVRYRDVRRRHRLQHGVRHAVAVPEVFRVGLEHDIRVLIGDVILSRNLELFSN